MGESRQPEIGGVLLVHPGRVPEKHAAHQRRLSGREKTVVRLGDSLPDEGAGDDEGVPSRSFRTMPVGSGRLRDHEDPRSAEALGFVVAAGVSSRLGHAIGDRNRNPLSIGDSGSFLFEHHESTPVPRDEGAAEGGGGRDGTRIGGDADPLKHRLGSSEFLRQ